MKFSSFHRGAGYTLLETVIYIALLALFAAVIAELVLAITHSFAAARVSNRLAQSAMVSLDRISREVRRAESVDLGQSLFGASPGRLVLHTTIDEAPATVEFSVVDGALLVKIDGDSATTTAEGVTVENLIFYNFNTGRSQAVKTELALSGRVLGVSQEANFYSTTVLRGSY